MNSKFSHLCFLSAVIRSVYHHPLLSKIPQNTAAYHFKILCTCPKMVGVICKYLQVMLLQQTSGLQYQVWSGCTITSWVLFWNLAEGMSPSEIHGYCGRDKNKDIDRSIILTLACFKTGFLFLSLVVLKLNL